MGAGAQVLSQMQVLMNVMGGGGKGLRFEMIDEPVLDIDGHPFLHGYGLGTGCNGVSEQRATQVSGITDAPWNTRIPSFEGGAKRIRENERSIEILRLEAFADEKGRFALGEGKHMIEMRGVFPKAVELLVGEQAEACCWQGLP